MAATALDAVTHTAGSVVASFAPSAGSNRVACVAVIYAHGSDAAPPTSATLGTQAMSELATVDFATSNICMTVFYLLEAGIAAMSGSTFTPSGGTNGGAAYTASVYWSVQGADQAAPAQNSSANSLANSWSLSLARVADSFTVGIAAHNVTSDGSLTSVADPSEAAEFQITSGDIAYGSATDTARTASFSGSSSFSRDNASVVINFAPVSASTHASAFGGPFGRNLKGNFQ